MKESSQETLSTVITLEILNKALVTAFEQFRIDFGREIKECVDERINALDQKMMSGFEMVFERFDKIERHIDDLVINKADVQDVLTLQKRIIKLEEKTA